MSKNIEHVQHLKSNVVINGGPKLPNPSALTEGEIAVNYASGYETLSIKNASGDVVSFSSDQTIGTMISDSISGKADTSAVTESINAATSGKLDTSAFETYSGNVDTEIDLKAAQSDLNTLSGTVTGHTADTTIHLTSTEKGQLHTHSNMSALDSITGNVGTMAYEDKASYSSATEVNAALGNKANTSDLASYADSVKYNSTSHYVEFYHGTTAGTKVFEYDASPFIIDGMVQNVEIKDVTSGGSQITCLVISFNTDSGKQDINVPISDIFDANNYYNKAAIDNLVGSGFTSSSITEVIIENEEIVSAALTDLDRRKLDASAYTPTDLSNYYTKSETSGATEISNALGGKVNSATYTGHTADTTIHFTTGAVQTQIDNSISGKVNTSDIVTAITSSNSGSTNPIATKVVAENELVVSTALNDLDTIITAHTASTVHMNGTEKTNLDSLATNIAAISGLTATDIQRIRTLTRRTRLDDFDFGVLRQAVIDQDLEKYGLKVGDYKTINGHTYVIAGLNTMKGTSTPYRIATNHVGIIVIPHTTCQWNTSSTTEGGYVSSNLHNYLTGTTLEQVRTDLGSYASGLLSHSKLYSNAVNTTGNNRYGSAGGCSSSWGWYSDQYISALSEIQVYGSIVWSSSGYDTGEACRQLDVFRVYNMNEIFGGEYLWLRDIASSSDACYVNSRGSASYNFVSYNRCFAALILFA